MNDLKINVSRFKAWATGWLLLAGLVQGADPLIWLDASQGLVLDNGKVATWTNLASPGTYDAVQNDAAKRPVVLLEEWSGQTLVYFDGVDDLLSLQGTAGNALLEGELTVFFVGRRREGGNFSPGGFVGNYHITDGSGTKGWHMGAKDDGTFQFRVGIGGNNEANGGIATLGTDYVVMAARYEDLGTGAGRMELFGTLNEEPAVRNTSTFPMDSSGWDITIGSHVGFKSSGFDRFTELDVAEIRIFGEALSDLEQQTVYEELAAKYSLEAKAFYNIAGFSPDSYSAPADSPIVLTFDVPMDPATIDNIAVGVNGLDGLPEQGGWQAVSGSWAASAGDTVFTFTPAAPFSAGSMVLVEIPDTVVSAEGGSNETGERELRSFIVDTGVTHTVDVSLVDPMAIVPQDNGDPHILPLELHIPDTAEPCPVMFWVHGGSFNGNNSGTYERSAILTANMAYYFAEKLGVAVANVAWRSSNSEGSITKVNQDINTAIQYVIDNATTLGIDTSRMGLYGGSAGSPTSGLVSQLNTNIICFIGFNGSYDFVEGGYGAGSTGFGQHLPSFEANSAIDNIRANPPATLLLHGSDDTIIPVGESLKYETALQAVGGDAETLVYRGFGHAFYNIGGNRPMHQPTLYASSKFISGVFNLGIYGDTARPPAPVGFGASAGDASVALSWTAVTEDDPVTYKVYRSTTSGNYGSALATGLSTNSYADTGVVNGSAYYYVVTVVDNEGNESAQSAEVLAIPALAGNLPPAFSADPIVEVNGVEGGFYSSALSDDASDPESDPMIFSKVSGPAWLSVAADGSLSGTAPASPGLNSFEVRVDAAGGGDTATLEITIDPDTTPPPVPSGLTAAAGDGAVTLNWTDNGDSDTASYRVYRSTTSSSYGSALVSDLSTSSYVDNTVTNGVTYHYVVTAVDAGGNESGQSGEDSATPDFVPDATPPASPTGLVATAGDGSVTLNWDNNGETDFASYRVFRSTTPGSYTGALVSGLGTSSYVDTSVTNGVGYHYVVTAIDTSGNESLQSDEGSAVPTEASAVVIAAYTFDGSSMASFDSDPNSAASAIAEGGGLAAAFETRDNRGDPKPALKWTAGDYNDGTILDTDYLTFTITPEAGVSLAMGQISLLFNGVTTSVHVFSSQSGFTAFGDAIASMLHTNGTPSTLTADLSGMDPVTGPIEFRLYFDTAATFSPAEVWIDNIQVSATAGTSDPDGDGDGMDDSWEVTNFGSREAIDGSLDSDGDGVFDFFEYLYGSDPNEVASSGFRLQVGPGPSGNQAVFDWKVREGFVLGFDYEAQISTDLASWDPLPEEHYSLQMTTSDGKTRLDLLLTHDYGSEVFLRLAQP